MFVGRGRRPCNLKLREIATTAWRVKLENYKGGPMRDERERDPETKPLLPVSERRTPVFVHAHWSSRLLGDGGGVRE